MTKYAENQKNYINYYIINKKNNLYVLLNFYRKFPSIMKKIIFFLIYCNIFVIQMQQKHSIMTIRINSNCYFIKI